MLCDIWSGQDTKDGYEEMGLGIAKSNQIDEIVSVGHMKRNKNSSFGIQTFAMISFAM